MTRLVDPISEDEFNNLPKWQQWVSNNPLAVVSLFAVFFSIILFLFIVL